MVLLGLAHEPVDLRAAVLRVARQAVDLTVPVLDVVREPVELGVTGTGLAGETFDLGVALIDVAGEPLDLGVAVLGVLRQPLDLPELVLGYLAQLGKLFVRLFDLMLAMAYTSDEPDGLLSPAIALARERGDLALALGECLLGSRQPRPLLLQLPEKKYLGGAFRLGLLAVDGT